MVCEGLGDVGAKSVPKGVKKKKKKHQAWRFLAQLLGSIRTDFGLILGGFSPSLPTPAPVASNWEPSLAQHHLGSTAHGGAGPPGGCSSPCLNPPDSAPRGRISPFKGKAAAVSLNLSPAFGFLCAAAIRELKPVFYFPFDLLESGAGMFYFRWHQLWPGGAEGDRVALVTGQSTKGRI